MRVAKQSFFYPLFAYRLRSDAYWIFLIITILLFFIILLALVLYVHAIDQMKQAVGACWTTRHAIAEKCYTTIAHREEKGVQNITTGSSCPIPCLCVPRTHSLSGVVVALRRRLTAGGGGRFQSQCHSVVSHCSRASFPIYVSASKLVL
ncbi:hypothetical protein BO82DRAFT_187707 [Aspergillus uvarum CBS 121591]|uniref:Uncharacterized protein n=1 Tax=Aspergillus uvarum CBS 121591 TaxID=1448315 RepID=A0A319BWZ4_9EURO|nr:hypothetical protein BO82DRAFT_187707 [Aspergillus uvarum CBS 121591]PYH77224.1 hypothetical protein BO82DRAFT_187707 [Aspergillus uvarum CBS 121591]